MTLKVDWFYFKVVVRDLYVAAEYEVDPCVDELARWWRKKAGEESFEVTA